MLYTPENMLCNPDPLVFIKTQKDHSGSIKKNDSGSIQSRSISKNRNKVIKIILKHKKYHSSSISKNRIKIKHKFYQSTKCITQVQFQKISLE